MSVSSNTLANQNSLRQEYVGYIFSKLTRNSKFNNPFGTGTCCVSPRVPDRTTQTLADVTLPFLEGYMMILYDMIVIGYVLVKQK